MQDTRKPKVTISRDWVTVGNDRIGYVHNLGQPIRNGGPHSWRFGVDDLGTLYRDGYPDRQSAVVALAMHVAGERAKGRPNYPAQL